MLSLTPSEADSNYRRADGRIRTRINRFTRPAIESRNDQHDEELRDELQTEVPTVVPCPHCGVGIPILSPDLACIVDEWDHLPESVRSTILTLIKTARQTEN